VTEDSKERVDRELMELLNELRVALPGVQVLFAFLLTIPFTQRFDALDTGDRRVYFGAVIATALSSALLMAPSAHHRLRFRQGSKEHLLKVSNGLALGGMFFMAGAIAASMYVITHALYESGTAAVVAGMVGGGTVLLWFAVPFLYRSQAGEVVSHPRPRRSDEPRAASRAGQA
jgi:hypothetical protein